MIENVETQPEQKVVMYYLGIPVTLSETLDGFRYNFDPKYEVNEAHATLVAPFPALLMTEDLSDHFSRVIASFKQQEITARHFYITSRGYIFYTFDMKSREVLSSLYDLLYEHPALKPRKEERAFLPHITIGKFNSERAVPRIVRDTLPEICESMTFMFDRVRLYGILQEPKKRAHVQDYFLTKPVFHLY